ncbi:transcription antitermination factor NusB [Longimicrobium sp.]|uniref:transcription antitermination factor NusB n=1 Tax=Longimicrobium sp. TaxID=2029185 RepID=UPI002BAA6F72|nr:transcription antitermination factor NusB [Longimicrobium sp.]HSU13602.1 transcription antitermination factor NusB [Longimicrobium sp.]
MRSRSKARGWALQGLYAWESRGGQPEDAMRILQTLFSTLRVSPANRPYAEVLVRLVATNLERIDALVLEALTNWRMERLAAIDRNVLRLGVAEMLFVDDVAPRITIREMVQLAEKYGTHDSPRFVNGVLDAVMRRVAPEGAAPAR